MAFLAKLGLVFSLAFSSFLGLFHHGQGPVSTIATSTVETSSQPAQTDTLKKFTLSNGWSTPFSLDANHVYFNDNIIAEADPRTFVFIDSSGGDVISGYYAKDASHVYFADNSMTKLTVVQSADSSTFTLVPVTLDSKGLAIQSASCGDNCHYDAQDKNHKYLQGQIVQDSQTSATTTVFDMNGNPTQFKKDSIHIYTPDGFAFYVDPENTIIDTSTFVVVDGWFRKDKNYVYMRSPQSATLEVIAGADPATFTLVKGTAQDSEWAVDKNYVYNFWSRVDGASPATFRIYKPEGLYATDGNYLYYSTADGYGGTYEVIRGADITTFTVVSGQSTYDAQDKNHKYLQGQIVQ